MVCRLAPLRHKVGIIYGYGCLGRVTAGPALHMSVESGEVICIKNPGFLGRGQKSDPEQLKGTFPTVWAQLPKGRSLAKPWKRALWESASPHPFKSRCALLQEASQVAASTLVSWIATVPSPPPRPFLERGCPCEPDRTSNGRPLHKTCLKLKTCLKPLSGPVVGREQTNRYGSCPQRLCGPERHMRHHNQSTGLSYLNCCMSSICRYAMSLSVLSNFLCSEVYFSRC